MQEFLATGKVLYVLAGLCLLSMFCKWMTKSLYKRLTKETTNMAMTKNKNLKTLKQRIESTYRVNGGVGNMAVYLERQAADFKFLKVSLSGWANFSNQLTMLCFLVGGTAAFLAYWYRNDTYYIALYGTMGILTGLLTMVEDMGVNLNERRQLLLVALEDYMDNSLFFRPGKGRMAAAEAEDSAHMAEPAVRGRETGRNGELTGRSAELSARSQDGPSPALYDSERVEYKESAAGREGGLRSGLRRGRRRETPQPEPQMDSSSLKSSLEQIAASRDKAKPDADWLKDLKPEEVKLLGEIIREYLA